MRRNKSKTNAVCKTYPRIKNLEYEICWWPLKLLMSLFYNQVSIKIEYSAFKKRVVWRYSVAKAKGDVLKS